LSNWDKQQIITSYKQAKNKAEQVTILAQLTETDNETIVMILEDAGIYEGAYKKCQQCGRDYAIKYKQGRTKYCEECRQKNEAIYKREWQMKRNMAKIQEIARKNEMLRREVEEMRVTI
jgi:hypothetical protein